MSSASLEDGEMNRDPTRPRAQAFCFFFAKRKGCHLKRHPICGKAAGGRFAQAAGGLRFVTHRTSTSLVVFCRLHRR